MVEPESQHPHPAAPSELQQAFSDFVKKFESSSSSVSQSNGAKGGTKEAFGEFWEAPARFWRPRIRELEDGEIDAISVCHLFCSLKWVLMHYGGTERWCFATLISADFEAPEIWECLLGLHNEYHLYHAQYQTQVLPKSGGSNPD